MREVLHQTRQGTLAGQVRTGATFADAAAWLRYVEVDRQRKASTVAGYKVLVRSPLLPAFGSLPLEEVTTRALVLLPGIVKRARKVWGLSVKAAAAVEKPALKRGGDIQVFSPEAIWALVRAAASSQDAAVFVTAAFTGLPLDEHASAATSPGLLRDGVKGWRFGSSAPS